MQQTPVHLGELLGDLAPESIDLLIESAQPLGDRLDVGPELLANHAEVTPRLGGRRVHTLEDFSVQAVHVTPRLRIPIPDLLAELLSHGGHLCPQLRPHQV